jgi:predicted anti-sigma-YlaC factor YlaD
MRIPFSARSLGQRIARALVALLALAFVSGCSVNKFAVGKLGDALSSGSGGTFGSDDDPELIKAAVPFSLKLMESLLASVPEHDGLLFATASGFTQYSYAFVQQDADEMEATSFAGAQAMRQRAKRLYLRARNYGLRGLEARHHGFGAALTADPVRAVAQAQKRDVGLLYWTAAAWGAAIGVSKDDPALIGEIPKMEALIDRALALDEAWENGAIHSFLITYEMARANGAGDPAERSRQHFERALELAGGRLAGPYVTYAEAVPLGKQQAAEFRRLLQQALAIDADAYPPARLGNLVAQRRARWLLGRMDELFLNP